MFRRGTIYYERIGGKKVSSGLTNKKKAQEYFRKLQNQLEEEGSRLRGYTMPLAELFRMYLVSKASRCRPGTAKCARTFAHQFFKLFCNEDIFFSNDFSFYKGTARTKVIELTVSDVSQTVSQLLTGAISPIGGFTRKYKPSSIRAMCVVAKEAYNFGIELEFANYNHNPFRSKKTGIPKQAKGKSKELSFDQELNLYEACKNLKCYPWLYDAVCISLLTGLRRGNAISMEWKWVDFEKRIITIPATCFKRKPGDNAPHVSYISDRALEVLERRFSEIGDKSPYVFPRSYENTYWENRSNMNLPISGQTYWRAFTRAKKEAGGMEDCTPHTMRHDFACKAVQAPGNELHHVQRMMGHQSIQSTQIYAYLKTKDVVEAHKRTFDKPKMRVLDSPKSVPKKG